MKILKSPQKVLILFLTVLVVFSFIMILRLEGKTAILQSRLDEHHKSLEKNKDVLENLDYFIRKVKNTGISADGNNVVVRADQSSLLVQDNQIDLSSNGNVAIGHPKKSIIYIEKDGYIHIGPNSEKNLGYDKTEDFIYMLHNGSRVILGQHGTQKRQGIRLISKTGGPRLSVYTEGIIIDAPDKKGEYKMSIAPHKDFIKITKGNSVINLEKDNLNIEAIGDIRVGPTKDKYLGYNSKEDEIQIHQAGSTISFGECYDGKTLVGNGVKIQGKNNGPRLFVTEKNIRLQIPSQKGSYDITLDPSSGFLGLRCGESYVILEKDNIDIEAKGNINIKSLNGNVNINGKKVSLNE